MSNWRKTKAIGIALAVVFTANYFLSRHFSRDESNVYSVKYKSHTFLYNEGRRSFFGLGSTYNTVDGMVDTMRVTMKDTKEAEPFTSDNYLRLEEIVVHRPDGDKTYESTDTSAQKLFDKCNDIYNQLRLELFIRQHSQRTNNDMRGV